MNINHSISSRSTLGAGLLTLLHALPAAAATEPPDALLWLFDMPDWVLAGFVATLAAILFVMGGAFIRPGPGAADSKLQDDTGRREAYLAGTGTVLGLLAALWLADPWHAYVLSTLTSMPPTAAGIDAVPESAVTLLMEPDAEGQALTPQTGQRVVSGRARHVSIDMAALQAHALLVDLFDNESLTARRDRVDRSVPGSVVWVGHLLGGTGEREGEVVLAARGAAVMGSIELNDGRSFEIVFVRGKTHALRQVDPAALPPEYEPQELEHPAVTDLAATAGDPVAAVPVASTGQIMDILVAYTPQARANAGSVRGIETRILNAVAKTNQAYLNSRIDIRLNLVRMVETAYAEAGDMRDTLAKLRGADDGFMDELHALRDETGADIVTLFSADASYCGITSVMTEASPAFAATAFAVVHDDSVHSCLGSNNTFAHELAHLQGNVHNHENSPYPGILPSAFGYRVCGVFRDIMAYPCQGEPRIPYFSTANQLLTYQGQPLGAVGSADIAGVMALTAPTLANFRTPAAVTSLPAAPTSLLITGASLMWTDNADNESGYTVERSVDGMNWTEAGAVVSDTNGFSDTGLTAGETYYYRVCAWNSAGKSAYSNVVQGTEPSLP